MNNQDISWKNLVEKLFCDFIEFFHVKLHNDIDFTKEIKFLDKEFATLFPDSVETNRFVDKLALVTMKDSTEKCIFVHIEVQGQRDDDFGERMFVYYYRVYDKYKGKITALAIFTDKDPSFNIDTYKVDCYETTHIYKYRTCKLLDIDDEELENSKNIFGLVALAAKNIHKYKDSLDQRYRFKYKLIKLLLTRGYDEKAINEIFEFIDMLIIVPTEMNKSIFNKISKEIKTEGATPMKYHETEGTIANYLYEEGKEKGKLEGKLEGFGEIALTMLRKGYAKSEIRQITGLTDEQINKLSDNSKPQN